MGIGSFAAKKAKKGISGIGKDKEKEKEEKQGQETDSRGEEKSQNEKTLSKVLKTIANVIAQITMLLIQLFWPILLVLFLGALLLTFLGYLLDLFNSETASDTDTAVIETGTIIEISTDDEEFTNEILNMINENADTEEIYSRIKQRLIEEGMDAEKADNYKEVVLKTIKSYAEGGEGAEGIVYTITQTSIYIYTGDPENRGSIRRKNNKYKRRTRIRCRRRNKKYQRWRCRNTMC